MPMLFRKTKRIVPGLNTTSTADISFMLLILFLVTPSMDVDKGISQQLPPPEKEQSLPKPQEIDRQLVMQLYVDEHDSLKCNNFPVEIDLLNQRVIDFVTSKGSNHVIRLEMNRASSYETYFRVQNEIARAYMTLRDQEAERRFGIIFRQCSDDEQAQINEAIPQHVVEIYHKEAKP